MENISDRIIQTIKALGITKSEFARRLNISPSYISKLSKEPERTPSERMLIDICRTFGISYPWLTTGEGEMFSEVADAVIDKLVKTYNLNEEDKEIIVSYLKLSQQERDIFKKVVKGLAK